MLAAGELAAELCRIAVTHLGINPRSGSRHQGAVGWRPVSSDRSALWCPSSMAHGRDHGQAETIRLGQTSPSKTARILPRPLPGEPPRLQCQVLRLAGNGSTARKSPLRRALNGYRQQVDLAAWHARPRSQPLSSRAELERFWVGKPKNRLAVGWRKGVYAPSIEQSRWLQQLPPRFNKQHAAGLGRMFETGRTGRRDCSRNGDFPTTVDAIAASGLERALANTEATPRRSRSELVGQGHTEDGPS